MLNQDTDTLLAQATAFETEKAGIDYRMRVAVERTIFRTAKTVARRHLLFNLCGFSLSSQMELMAAVRLRRPRPDVRFCLDLAFELAAALGNLASGDAYVRKELMLEAIPGRLGAVKLFG